MRLAVSSDRSAIDEREIYRKMNDKENRELGENGRKEKKVMEKQLLSTEEREQAS